MHKSRVVLVCMALALILAFLIPLVSCSKGSVTTATPTPTSTSTSGKTLRDIYGGGKNLGDVQFDVVTTTSQSTQAQTAKAYCKNYATNKMKFRQEGTTQIFLMDYSAQTAYLWTPGQNTAYKIDFSQVLSNPMVNVANADQIHPTYLGTDTVDGNLCDMWQWTYQVTGTTGTEKMWIWKDKSFPVKMETTTSGVTTTIEYHNIVFGTLSDSLFQLPAGVQVTQLPSSSPP
jgi:hypothetical protein